MSNYQVESEESGSSRFPCRTLSQNQTDRSTYYYFNRQGWNNKDTELKTTTSKELPAGTYYAVIDYKAADYSNNNNANNNGTTIGIKVNDAASNLLGENPAVRRAYSMANNGSNPGSDAYMVNAAWNELGTMFTVTEPTTITISLVQNMKNSGRSDIAWDNLRLYQIENVSEGSPMDVSGLITTSNYYALGGWKIEGGNTFQINTWSTEGDTDGSGMTKPFIQDWVGKGTNAANATISHTANHLVPGIYEVSGLIRVLNEAGGATPSGATLYANEGSTDACTGTPCTNGVYGTYTVKGTVGTDRVLTFGIKVANANFNWVSFKNFKLQYLGVASIDQLKATLKEKMTEAQACVANCPKGIAAIVNAAITQGNNAQDTEESLNAAITALTQAIALAEQAVPATEAFKALMSTCQSYANHSTAEESVKQAFQKAMTDAQAALDAATTVEAIQEAIQPLQTACETYVLNAVPETGHPFDYTFLMDEANNSNNGWTKNVTEGNIQNFTYKNSAEKNNGDLQKTGFMELGMGQTILLPSPIPATNSPTGTTRFRPMLSLRLTGTPVSRPTARK